MVGDMRPVGKVQVYGLTASAVTWRWTLKEQSPFDCIISPVVFEDGETRYKCLTSLGWVCINEGDFIIKTIIQGIDFYFIFSIDDIKRELK